MGPLQVNLSVNHSPDARNAANMEKEMAMQKAAWMDKQYKDPTLSPPVLFPDLLNMGHRDPFDFIPPWMSRSELYNSMSRISRYDDDFMNYGPPSRMDFASMMHDPMSSMPFGGGRGMPPSDMGYFPEDYGAHYGSNDYGPPPRGGHPDTMEFTKQGRQHVSNSEEKRLKKDYWNPNRNLESKYGGHKSTSPCAGGGNKAESGTRLFVQNLPELYEQSHLKQLFSSYGEITDVTIQRDRHGKSIQCGFVSFSVSNDANNALEALDGVMLSTQTLVIHVM